MRSLINAISFFLFIGLFISIGCSGSKAPTAPGDPLRCNEGFDKDSWPLWQSGSVTTKYQEVDLSVLVYGPDPPSGETVDYPVETEYVFLDRYWTIAVTIEQNYGGDPSINYAWLDDVSNPDGGPPIARG